MNNEDTISLFLKNILPDVSKKSIDEYKTLTSYKTFSKGDILINYGVKSYDCFIVKSGILASNIEKPNGNDFIRTLFNKLMIVGSAKTLFSNEKNDAKCIALTDCEVYQINALDYAKSENPEFKELQLKSYNSLFLKKQKRIMDLSTLNATERYIQLREDIPNIDNTIPQHFIASYLNITSVQLSRIRKKISC